MGNTTSANVTEKSKSVSFAQETDDMIPSKHKDGDEPKEEDHLGEQSENDHQRSGSVRLGPTVKTLRSNLMRVQKDRDPLFFYEVVNVLGVGSMGSVSKVRKRDETMGGSARKELVESFSKEKKIKSCLQIPIVGGLFRFCISSDNVLSSERLEDNSSGKREGSSRPKLELTFSRGSSSNISFRGTYEAYYAMKSIHLDRVTDPTFVDELKNEIQILKKLDHPHIVRPMETFEHRNQLFILMELCSGGDLYSRDPYTEEEAARITSSILNAVAYMHHKKIIHRDLKYENILFVNESPRAEIKLIDFGLSKKYGGEKTEFSEGVGTIYTMAPEVLEGHYTSQADLWSVGVITYMLLSSQMPFFGRKRRHIVEQIMNCQFALKGRRWKRVSNQAKAFVEDLLVKDPADRATANEALSGSWLNKRYSATVRGPTQEEIDTTTGTLKQFAGYSKLKKLALMVIAHKSTSEEIGILRKVFQKYDVRGDGNIQFPEFKKALGAYNFSDAQLKEMFEGVDLDGTGKIRYTEFLAATIEAQGAIDEERLAEAFDRLDSDDSGYISATNLREILGEDFPQEEIDQIIREADRTKDDQISYPEFLALWENKNEIQREQMIASFRPEVSPTLQDDVAAVLREQEKKDLREETEAENATVSRVNFLEGKQMSERKVEQAAKINKTQAKKILFAETIEVIPDVHYENDEVQDQNGGSEDITKNGEVDVTPPLPTPAS